MVEQRGFASQPRQRHGQLPLLCGIAVLLIAGNALAAAASQVKPAALFVLGDSYSDTGNRNKSNPLTAQGWKYPYGITWGAGRFSDGRVSTDYLVELIGLPPLKTYASITESTPPRKLRQGVNFAVGGAGVFPVDVRFRIPTIFQQVDQLKDVLSRHPNLFSPEKSVVVISCSGNDYTQLGFDNPDATDADYIALAGRIVRALGENVENLYNAGFRNFAILNQPPSGCFPTNIGQNATRCNPEPRVPVEYHNAQLTAIIANLQRHLLGARFVVLDLVKSFKYVIDNSNLFGIRHPLGACCAPLRTHPSNFCGNFDAQGNPLFTVCPDPAEFFFWDGLHPSDAGWKAVVNLFYSGFNITVLSPNLLIWLNSLDLASRSKDSKTYEKAALDVVQALAPGYPHLFPVLSIAGALSYLPTFLISRVGPVTVFLPSEEAVEKQVGVEFLHNWPAVASEVALGQVVYGWWPAERLQKLRNGYSLRTLRGSKVHLFREDGTIFLAAGEEARGTVAILHPTLFAAEDAVLVHKTSALVLQPYGQQQLH